MVGDISVVRLDHLGRRLMTGVDEILPLHAHGEDIPRRVEGSDVLGPHLEGFRRENRPDRIGRSDRRVRLDIEVCDDALP